MNGYCHQCHHAWMAHDDGTDDGDHCRVCECDGFVPLDDGGSYFIVPTSGHLVVTEEGDDPGDDELVHLIEQGMP